MIEVEVRPNIPIPNLRLKTSESSPRLLEPNTSQHVVLASLHTASHRRPDLQAPATRTPVRGPPPVAGRRVGGDEVDTGWGGRSGVWKSLAEEVLSFGCSPVSWSLLG